MTTISQPLIPPKEFTMRRRMLLLLLMGTGLMPGVARAQGGPEEVRYYHTDAIGSVRLVTSASGQVLAQYDYLPFGELWQPPAQPETRRFAGQERDSETGFDYFGARYYASQNGRFTTVDPGHVGGDIFNPQTWNAYAYALNNPLRFVDPLGMEPCQITLRGADAAAAGVADGGTVEGECVRGKTDSWLSRQFFGFLDLMAWTEAVQAPGVGEADLPLPDRSPDTAVLAAAAIMGAPRGVAGRITGRLTQEGLEHIVLRHWATSGAQGAGKFLAGTTARSLKGMINQALEQGAVRANTLGRAGQIVEYDFGRQIGVNITGQVSTRLRVVLWPDGTVRTAFPF